MKYGIREICDVVLRAKATQTVGSKVFYKDEPVIYFDSLKTTTLEGAATTVYATGGRGNTRLIAWEGERTLTFTMEDALISPVSFMILSGAGLIESGQKLDNGETAKIYVHTTETVKGTYDGEGDLSFTLSQAPYCPDDGEHYIYVMPLDKNGEKYTEPLIAKPMSANSATCAVLSDSDSDSDYKADYSLLDKSVSGDGQDEGEKYVDLFVDYYIEKASENQAIQIEITPDQFGGNYYLEASTLFRRTDGVDEAAEFIIPNCKVQSNFTFNMSSSGDPSTFSFVMDAFPDYLRFDKSKKVLAAIQVISHEDKTKKYGDHRTATAWDYKPTV